MAFWSRRDDERTPPSDACALCGQVRAEVKRLIVGTKGAICDGCVREATWLLDDEAETSSPTLGALVLATMERDGASHARITALGLAAVELAGTDVELLRRIGVSAIARSNVRVAIEAYSRIPIDVRTVHDRLHLSYAHSEVDEIDQAIRVLPGVEETTSPLEELHVLLNGASIALLATPPPDGAALTQAREQLERALLLEKSGAGNGRLHGNILGSLAHVDFLMGEFEAAEARLRDLERLEPPPPKRRLLLGDTLWAKGERLGARQEWEAVLRVVHPDSADAEAARRRLAPEYR